LAGFDFLNAFFSGVRLDGDTNFHKRP
jgi:hypothetical protein